MLSYNRLLYYCKQYQIRNFIMKNRQEYETQPNVFNLERSSPLIFQEVTQESQFNRENVKEFIENQAKTESRKNSKQKLRLPNINKNIPFDQDLINFQLSGKPLKLFMEKNDKEKLKQNNQDKQDIFQNQIKGAKLLINIKAVKPSIKNSSQKKKDRSLRDLRMLRRQQNIQSSQGNKQVKYFADRQSENSSNAIVSINKKSEKTIQKLVKNDRRSSQKLKLNRQSKSFSITNNKKKFSINYLDFCLFISLLNNFNKLPESNSVYKAFVAKGNNSILIKNVIKTRFWWNITENQTDVNLVWSQNRRSDLIQQFSKFQSKRPSTNQKYKKHKFHLQNKGDEKFNQNLKQFTKIGFLKLVSQKQIKQTQSTAYFSQINIDQNSSRSIQSANKLKMHNHLEFNWHLTNKKALYYNLKAYYTAVKQDPFKFIPLTFHIKEQQGEQWNNFLKAYEQRLEQAHSTVQKKQVKKNKKSKKQKEKQKSGLWIIKPGQNSNQGCGIQVSDSLQQIKEMIRSKHNLKNGKNRSHIIQRYLMPFLYNKRKFDIRCYILVTSTNSIVKGYWYQEGYIRTSSKQFTTKNLKNRMIHLTNDAVQKKGQDYGKYQNANKISYTDFQKYLDNNFADKQFNFFKTVYPQMMKLTSDALKATYTILDPNKRQFTFQIFGLDFMIDQDFNTWLIEVNNNPCLQLCSPLLARIIPNMIQNAFKIALDPMFPPPALYSKAKTMANELFQNNKFCLIFNSNEVQKGLQAYLSQNKNLGLIVESDEESQQMEQDECQIQKEQ